MNTLEQFEHMLNIFGTLLLRNRNRKNLICMVIFEVMSPSKNQGSRWFAVASPWLIFSWRDSYFQDVRVRGTHWQQPERVSNDLRLSARIQDLKSIVWPLYMFYTSDCIWTYLSAYWKILNSHAMLKFRKWKFFTVILWTQHTIILEHFWSNAEKMHRN